MRRREVYKAAVAAWGKPAQLMMMVEEMSELCKAIAKWFRISSDDMTDEIIEEAADVSIMLSQVKSMLNEEELRAYYAIKSRKMRRIEKRLNEYGVSEPEVPN